MPYFHIRPLKKTSQSAIGVVNMLRKDPDVRRLTIMETFVNGSDDWLVRVSYDDTEIENIIKARLDLHKDMYSEYEINSECGWTL